MQSLTLLHRLLPNLDRDDKFQLLNSVYRFAFFTYHQCVVLLWFVGTLAILPPFLKAQMGVTTTGGYVLAAGLLFVITGLISAFFGDFLLEKIKSKFRDSPHIKHADVRFNITLFLVGILIFAVLAFGIHYGPVGSIDVQTTPLLNSEEGYVGVGDLGQSVLATVYYATIVFFAISGVFRGTSVAYYNFRL